jgi:hypothetical protein
MTIAATNNCYDYLALKSIITVKDIGVVLD